MASISELSRQYGLDEHAIRFLLGQISGFPIFLLYTIFIRKLPLNLQYLYIITTGIGVAYWSFGFECICHTIICIAINNLVLNYGPSGSSKSRFYTATILVLFQFGYLLVGYWNRDKWMEYEAAIDWTTPHCILCMRLMAITMDFYDGHSSNDKKDEEKIKKNVNALEEMPGLFSTLAYIFFIGGYFVGPQYSYKHFVRCMRRNINEKYDIPLFLVLKKFLLAFVLLVIIVVNIRPLSSQYALETKEFVEMPYLNRYFHWVCWGHLVIAKYALVWTLADGVIILSGIGFSGNSEDGTSTWTAGENINVPNLIVATTGTSFNKAFNIKTGDWLAYYVFKRLRFFNNIHISQIITMLFVAAWHGLCSGYFISFGIQGLNLTFERYLFAQLQRSLLVKSLSQKLGHSYLALACQQIFLWGHKLLYTPCVLLGMHTFTYDRYWPIMRSVGAHWIFISYLIIPITINVLEGIYRSSLRTEDNHRTKLSPNKNGVNGVNGVIQNGKPNKLE